MSRVRPLSSHKVPPKSGWYNAIVSWLCLALVAFNLVAGAALPPSLADAESAFGERIVICSAAGMSVVDLGAVPGQTVPSSHGGLCAFCLPLLHGAVPLPLTVAVVELPALRPVFLAVPQQSARPVRFEQGGAAGPRAPPVI